MLALPFDIKLIIASANQEIWYLFYRYDREFTNYACSAPGKQLFIAHFTDHTGGDTMLFGMLHSIYDEPALTQCHGGVTTKYWYYANRLHRDMLPAVVSRIRSEWWQHGKRHRDNWKPAVRCWNRAYYIRGHIFQFDIDNGYLPIQKCLYYLCAAGFSYIGALVVLAFAPFVATLAIEFILRLVW